MHGETATAEPLATAGLKDRGTIVFPWEHSDPDDLFDGTAASRASLATALAARGHPVAMAYAGRPGAPHERQLREWVNRQREPHLRFAPVPEWNNSTRGMHFRRDRVHEFYRWLRHLSADGQIPAVVVPDSGGIAYYALLARQANLAFGDTRFIVDASGPMRFHRERDARPLESIEELTVDFMERRSVEMADRVVTPSHELSQWLVAAGWLPPTGAETLPPHPLPTAGVATRPLPDAQRFNRIVFVAPLAACGNLRPVCDALAQMAARGMLVGTDIVFWGPPGAVGYFKGSAYLESRLKDLGLAWRIEGDLTPGALPTLIAARETLFVFPAGTHVAPCAFSIIGALGLPFLESDQTPALDLAPLMSRCLSNGLPSPPPAVAPAPTPRTPWPDVVLQMAREPNGQTHPPPPPDPLVSVCLVTRNRPALLQQAMASIEAQDYPSIQLILVDDGSDEPEAIELLERLVPRLAARGWRVIRQPHLFHTVARNRAADEASGEFLLFMDDDNVAEPNEVSVLIRAARATGAHVLTCGRYIFSGEAPPLPSAPPHHIWMPLGNVPVIGLLQNCIGDMNFLVRRDTFAELGGFFTGSRGYAFERDFFRRAWLAGKRIEVVPELLYHYRHTPQSLSTTRKQRSEDLARDQFIARRYADLLPNELRDLPALVQALHRQTVRLKRRAANARQTRGGSHAPARPSDARLRPLAALLARLARSIKKRIRAPR